MPRSRGVGAAFDRRLGYPDASRVRCPCRLDGPSHHRDRYCGICRTAGSGAPVNEPSPVVRGVATQSRHGLDPQGDAREDQGTGPRHSAVASMSRPGGRLRGRDGSSEAAVRTVEAVTGPTARSLYFRAAGRGHGIEMVSMRQSDHAPLLRLVAAGSVESRRFVLRLPAKGKSNAC